ncbi:MAG: hypothetical protein EOP56_07465 [Sphingobacteriales bacterium]|nr:MAG: hypothetical protein EOP56_07465 [Sphingobacteriales bacterium]
MFIALKTNIGINIEKTSASLLVKNTNKGEKQRNHIPTLPLFNFSLRLSYSMRKIAIIIGSLFATVAAMYFAARMIAPGSYPFAEVYELDYKEERVIKAIEGFKRTHPEYSVPNVTIDGKDAGTLSDERSEDPGLWYHFYFYFPDENKIIHTWTRSNFDGGTDFAFVGVNYGLELGNWKRINDEFCLSENRRYEKKFEAYILEPIKNELKH